MPRLARCEIFDASEIACVHVISRTVRKCFLLGVDSTTNRNFDHRRGWIVAKLQALAANFGIDLICYSVMSNHLHQVLRSRPDVVATWDDTEVAKRWLTLCPLRKNKVVVGGVAYFEPVAPTESDLNTIRKNPKRLAEIRRRLSDISWWVRLLAQYIAMRANREDGEGMGKFWNRFKAVRLLDEESILACSAYVELNPIRAALAQTLESSNFTSVQRRIASFVSNGEESSLETETAHRASDRSDSFLAPVAIREQSDPIGPRPSRKKTRCSDKGFASMTLGEYLTMLDWAARTIVPNKPGSTPLETPPLFERLGIDSGEWLDVVANFGALFGHVAGKPQSIVNARSRRSHRRFYIKRRYRRLTSQV